MEKLCSIDAPRFVKNQKNDLREVLQYMARYGKVRIGQYGNDGTWHCVVELNIKLPGAAFEIKTSHGRDAPKCPLETALKCKELLDIALESAREQLAKLGTD